MRTDTTWSRYQGSPALLYERHFVPTIGAAFADRVIAAARPGTGERVVDIGCGTGVVARMAAERVGTTGAVVGVDGHPGMLAVARTTRPDLEWHQASADGLPFGEGSFDVALCSLALQFFAEKVRALQEMRRVVRDGGRLAVATAGPTPPGMETLREVLAEHVGGHVGAFVDAVFEVDDPARLHELLAAADLDVNAVDREELSIDLDAPADFLWQYLLGTPLAEAIAPLDDAARAALEDDVVARWDPFVVDGRLVLDVGIVLGTATVGR